MKLSTNKKINWWKEERKKENPSFFQLCGPWVWVRDHSQADTHIDLSLELWPHPPMTFGRKGGCWGKCTHTCLLPFFERACKSTMQLASILCHPNCPAAPWSLRSSWAWVQYHKVVQGTVLTKSQQRRGWLHASLVGPCVWHTCHCCEKVPDRTTWNFSSQLLTWGKVKHHGDRK